MDDVYELAAKVIDIARTRGLTIGTAESCTGGLVSGALTAVPGSSEVLLGGIVSYANRVKCGVLGVHEETLKAFGAVSEQTACEMANGARRVLECDVAVSTTGIAGPGGAVPGKPVGTVWVGIASTQACSAEVFYFKGERDEVREQAVVAALKALLRVLE